MDLFTAVECTLHNTSQCIEKLHADTYFTTLCVSPDSTVDAEAGAAFQGKICMNSTSLSGFVVKQTERHSWKKNLNS